MPTAFYILFTQINRVQIKTFSAEYMGSMMVYSILITAIMGVGNFMERDRNQGLITLLKIANRNLNHYYISICFLEFDDEHLYDCYFRNDGDSDQSC